MKTKMSKIELCVRVISKLMLMCGVGVLLIGGGMVESLPSEAVKVMTWGACMAVPDVVIWQFDGLFLR